MCQKYIIGFKFVNLFTVNSPMDIRNILQQKQENKVKKFWILLLFIFFLCILVVLGILIHKEKNKREYFIWENISISGKLHVHNNYPTNTHIITDWFETVGVKSSILNLNNFTDEKVLINGNISTITKEFPVLDISSLIIPDKKVKVTNNVYSFTKELIYFDFSKENELYAYKNWNTIKITHQWSPMMTIETFVCSKVTPAQDCEQLKKNYEDKDYDIFRSYWWHVFYKNQKDSWITFNDNEIWYIFKTDDDRLLSLSHLINIIDADFIKKNKLDMIEKYCIGEDQKISTITSASKSIIDDDLIKFDVNIIDNYWKEINCKLNIDIFNNWEIKNVNTN